MKEERLFGTDGIRGRANQYPMTPELVLKLGQAIGVYFKKRHTKPVVLIGKDTRRSGYMLEQALSAGIGSVGVDTYFLGPLPTPGIAYLTRGLRACAGVVISASHNPFDDNGIKIFNYDGYKLPDAMENEIESLLKADLSEHQPTGMSIGRSRRIDDAIGQYAVFLKEQFPKSLTLEGMRIVIDCAHGSSYKVAPKVFTELGAEVFTIGCEPNGKNINEGFGALHPETLREHVHLYKADVGLALDGDADRLIVVDDKGQTVDGDTILAICGLAMIQEGRLPQNTVVATIMSNMGLDHALDARGGRVVRTKVGDRYVVEEMRANAYGLGGEQSGHIIFGDSSTTGDGILAALQLLRVAVSDRRPISELRTCMRYFPQVLKNLRVKRKVPLNDLPQTEAMIRGAEQKLGAKGRVVFRYSGTEDLARLMIEGENEGEIEGMASGILDQLADEISLVVR